jgi:AhpD family alkylhydroperoxidase
MSIVELLDEHDYSDEVRTWDKKVREYTRAPAMTPYVKAAAHHLPYLQNMASEHIYVMPTRKLRRQLKETIAVAVSMVNNCRYCIVAHARLLSKMFSVTDAELVELTSAVAHISGLNRFETAILSGGAEPLFDPRPKEDVPLLGEIEEALGVLPIYYQAMANDPSFLDSVWAREKATMFSGSLKRLDKEFVAFVTSIVNVAGYSTRLHKQILEGLGATQDELFEALEVTEIFHKNNKFTEGLQLEPGLWGRN